MTPSNRCSGRFDSHVVPSLATSQTEILNVIALLADSLQALESCSGGIDANQYELLVAQLKTEMSRIDMNREYRTFGLCMHNNEHAVLAERITRGVIQACSRDTI